MTTLRIIPVTCDPRRTLKRVPLADLHAFQGNLKELRQAQFEQLSASLLEFGFTSPVFIWAGKNLILDGHQRVFVCRQQGWEVEGGVPVVELVARDAQEAAEKVLVISSTYGHLSRQGLNEFLGKHQLDLAQFTLTDLPGLPVEALAAAPVSPIIYPCRVGHFEFEVGADEYSEWLEGLPPACFDDPAEGRTELLARLGIKD